MNLIIEVTNTILTKRSMKTLYTKPQLNSKD